VSFLHKGMARRAIMVSSSIGPEDASGRAFDQGHIIILPAKTPDNSGPQAVHVRVGHARGRLSLVSAARCASSVVTVIFSERADRVSCQGRVLECSLF
jgi:hypothetical protein